MEDLQYFEGHDVEDRDEVPSLQFLMNSFQLQRINLVKDEVAEENGTIKVSTTRGAHLKADAVLQALKERAATRNRGTKKMTADQMEQRALQSEYRLDSAAGLRQLASLALFRRVQEACLSRSKDERRLKARLRVEKRVAPY